jgi:hypothetical protein
MPDEKNQGQTNRPKRVAGAVEGVGAKIFASQFLCNKAESPDGTGNQKEQIAVQFFAIHPTWSSGPAHVIA